LTSTGPLRAREQPALFAEGNGSDSVSIVDRQMASFRIADQGSPTFQRVVDGFGDYESIQNASLPYKLLPAFF
jgi:hypothetical protein